MVGICAVFGINVALGAIDRRSKNFDLRKELYGEDALGSANLQV